MTTRRSHQPGMYASRASGAGFARPWSAIESRKAITKPYGLGSDELNLQDRFIR